MDGQVLGGGVIVAVSVLLWLVYLVPSWHERRQFDAAERNAVRLNQALRVLAETSETPGEVRLELSARTAQVQHREAKRAIAERERLARQTTAELEQAATEQARAELAAARANPAARRARARRRARLLTTVAGLIAVGLAGVGVWQFVSVGTSTLLWWATGVALVCAMLLARMTSVTARAARLAAQPSVATSRVEVEVQDVALPARSRQWEPRRLPQPLTAASGSRAAATVEAAAAREALRHAAREEALRQRAAATAPPSIDQRRAERERAAAAGRQAPAAAADFARMGYVDDAEIEAHVRDLLTRRAAGA